MYRKEDIINVVLRDGGKKKLSQAAVRTLSDLVNSGISIDKALRCINEDKIFFNGMEVIIHGFITEDNSNNGDIIGIFFRQDYKFLNVKDKVVIDIGANIGDSPIYFALNGAKKVIALEPYPYSFNFAIRNVKENNLENKIILVNAGYGKDGELLIDENFKSNGVTELKSFEKGKKIKIYSLKSLIEEFHLDNDLILKMDCEGCEYNLLNENNSILGKFLQIQIEYHYGYKSLLVKLKNSGFSVRYTKPKRFYNKYATKPKTLTGYIYASKF
ncbi:MAG: FkbM family methyltransferase [Nanopusillaceae archaeon]